MKTDQIFIGDIRKCTKYNTHTTFSSSMYIGDQCIGCDSFGYVDEDDELYKENAVLIITHNTRILENLKVDYVHILVDGKIVKTGDASLAQEIEENGYSQYK